MGFFDSTIYGTKRLLEIAFTRRVSDGQSELGSFIAYKKQSVYGRPYAGLLLAAIVLLFLSVVLAFV